MPPPAVFVQAQGVPPTKIGQVVAAVKAYTTRVGEGPFPTEFDKKMNELSVVKAMSLAPLPVVLDAAVGLMRCLAVCRDH
jgi:hypothetical protein